MRQQYTTLATPTPTNHAQSYIARNMGPTVPITPSDASRPGRQGSTPTTTATSAEIFQPFCEGPQNTAAEPAGAAAEDKHLAWQTILLQPMQVVV